MKEEDIVSRKLETMIPLDVYKGLNNFAKVMTKTGLGKYDYGVAIRILLQRSDILEAVNLLMQDIQMLREEVSLLREKPKEEEVKTFGGKKK